MTIYRYNAESWDEFVHDLRTRNTNWGDLSQGSRVIGRASPCGTNTTLAVFLNNPHRSEPIEGRLEGAPEGEAHVD